MRSITQYIFFFSLSILSSCETMSSTKKFDSAWNQLLTSEDSVEEAKNVDVIRKLAYDHEASLSLTANLKNGQRINVIDTTYSSTQAVDFDLIITGDDITFSGKNWKPKDHNSIFRFFLE